MADPNPYDNNFDGSPGSDRESSAYSRRYRVDETTSLIRERAQEQQAEALDERAEQLERRIEEMVESAQMGRMGFLAGFGTFVVPRDPQSFADHKQLAESGDRADVHFDAQKYPYFDRIIAEESGRPEIFDANHPDYAKYQNVRTNLAVLRNYTAAVIKFGGDGTFDVGDEGDLHSFIQMAEVIGKGLRNERSLLGGMFGPVLNSELLNKEGDGGAYLYDFLRKQQHEPGFLSELLNDIRSLLGFPVHDWGLPPIAATPFSEQGLNAPASPDVLSMTEAELREHCRQHGMQENSVLEEKRQAGFVAQSGNGKRADQEWGEYVRERVCPCEVAHAGPA